MSHNLRRNKTCTVKSMLVLGHYFSWISWVGW